MTASPALAEARRLLLGYYQQWQTLSEAEGEAIGAGNWPEVARLQAAKQQLQQAIVSATETLRAGAEADGVAGARIESEFHNLVDHLIQLESRNRDQIMVKRMLAREAWTQLQLASQNLRQIQRAYATARGASWQSYS